VSERADNIRWTCIIVAVAVALLFAGRAYAVDIRNGRELTAKVWPDGTQLDIRSDYLYADKPVQWNGTLRVKGNGSSIVYRQWKDGGALFSTGDGAKLQLENVNLISTEFPGGMNRCLLVDGRSAFLANVTVAGGDTILLRRGHLNWVGGGTGKATPAKYGALYAGDVLTGDTGGTFWLQGLKVRSGKGETGLRLMGASGTVQNCEFDGRTNQYKKESVQIRHGNDRDEPIKFINCKFINSMVCGPLGKGGAGETSLKAYHSYAKAHPARIYFDGGSMSGYATCEGSVIVEYNLFVISGKDTWNLAPSYAIGARTHWMPWGKFVPDVVARGCTEIGYAKLAGSGVTVLP
jgi:hypothetical protein